MTSPDLHPDSAASSAADDLVLLGRVAEGDRDAFRRLYSHYHRRLHRFLMRLTRERQVTEEVINDTMMVVWQHAADFRGASRVSTWILGIAYRRALKTLERARNTSAQDVIVATATMPDGALLDALSQGTETHDWIDAALAQLSSEHRMVIELAYFLGLSCEEIAEIVGCPLGTVKTRMFYGRERLRQVLTALAAPHKLGGAVAPALGGSS
ncbi:MAG TPA: sigma-70 family RNA polymerase sigma factor [Steroidobacteraceae bacterium]|nr:sigma-70 family RNA polymerase sigma factor [Steroidobacteraceae bacterium]